MADPAEQPTNVPELLEASQKTVKTVGHPDHPHEVREQVREVLGDAMVTTPLVWFLVILSVTETIKPFLTLLVNLLPIKETESKTAQEMRAETYNALIKAVPMIVGVASGPVFGVECANLMGLTGVSWIEASLYGGVVAALLSQGLYTLVKDLRIAKLIKGIIWARGSAVAGVKLEPDTMKASPEEMAKLHAMLAEEEEKSDG